MKSTVKLALLLLAAASLPALSQTTYQWKDPKTGTTIYSDQSPPPGIAPQAVRGGSAPANGRQLPYATRLAAEKYPVVLYASDDCGEQCTRARMLLSERGVPYAEKMVKRDTPEFAQLTAMTDGEVAVPFLLVGSQRFKGFEPSGWNNLLDLAGYPKAGAVVR